MTASHSVLQALKHALDDYYPISDSTWQAFQAIITVRRLDKHDVLYPAGSIPSSFAWVYHGLIRGYVSDEKGNEYNKKFFDEEKFPGAMSALLTHTPSKLAFDALEETLLVEIDFIRYRQLLLAHDDLKMFQIHYLETNWLLEKDAREIAIVQLDASARYQQFLADNPSLAERLPQYHIASHLGITPTQLSRIRKNT